MTNQTIEKVKFVAVYARVSTSNQEDQKTIEAQLLEVRSHAAEHGYAIVREYTDEGWSGDRLARPSLDELRGDARKKLWQAVLIYDPDRLGRQLFYQQIVIDELRKQGIETLFVTMPRITNSSDELMFGVRGLFAQYEKQKIAERFRIGKVNRVTNGNVLAAEAPYGYTYVLNKGKRGSAEYVVGHYEINEVEAAIVREIFSWVADEGLTMRGVVRRLQERGVAPRKSKRGVWNTSTLCTLLRNQTYIGIAHWGVSYAVVPERPLKDQKYKKIEKTSRRIRPKESWHAISVPPLIDKELFEKAHRQLETNYALMQRNKKNEYLFAGMIRCACGRSRSGEGPMKGKHLYYRCSDRVMNYPLPRTCMDGGINARITDELVWDKLTEIMGSPETLIKYRNIWHASQQAPAMPVGDTDALKKEIEKLKHEEGRYTKAYGSGILTVEQLKEYVAPLREKIIALELRFTQMWQVKETVAVSLPSEEEIRACSVDISSELKNLGFAKKRAIVADVVEKVVATQKQVTVHGRIAIPSNYVELSTNDKEDIKSEIPSNINKNHVEYKTSYRYCRPTQRRQVDAV